MWTSVADLFTPTSLFFFLNLTIAAIAITSLKNKHPPSPQFPDSDHQYHHHQHNNNNEHLLARGPSLLERVRSLNFNFSASDSETETTTPTHHFDGRHHFFNHDDGGSSLPTTPTARALERASSLFKSLHFSPLRRSGGPDPGPGNPEKVPEATTGDHHHHRHFFGNDVVDGSSPPTTPTARALERASSLFKSINNFSPLRRSGGPDPELLNPETVPEPRGHFFANDVVDGSSPPTTPTGRALERASSLFKSHRFSPLLRSGGPDTEPEKPETVPEPRIGDHDHLVKRSKSEPEVREAAARGGRKTKMTKSASEKCAAEIAAAAVVEEKEEEERRRPATVRLQKAVSIGDDHGVDSKADDFINRFKQQLKLQRLDSLLRNRELLRAQQVNNTAS